MSRMCAATLLVTLAIAAPVAAQVPTTPPGYKTDADLLKKVQSASTKGGDPLADAFFPPELVMKNQQAIGLSADQRAAIVQAVQATQPRFIEAQWQLEAETAALAELVRGERVDEARVLQQIDRVLDLERQIKRSQIELLIRIKNQLTPEQQQQLARLGRGVSFFGSLNLAPRFDLAPRFELGTAAELFSQEYLKVRRAAGRQ